MPKDERDLLQLLKDELAFVEQGGYGRSVRTPWKSTSIFQDSLTCINYGYPYRVHSCNDCHLIDFVSEQDRTQAIPCHHIQLNDKDETVVDLEDAENQRKLEEEVKQWLRNRIKEIEEKSTTSDDPDAEELSVPKSSEALFCCQS